MYQGKPSRFRRRTNDRRRHSPRGNGDMQQRMRTNSFSNGQNRNNFRNTLSAEKSLEKYNALAKEAMSSGDKISSENYLQHVDHFMRIIKDRNRIQDENKVKVIEKNENQDKSHLNTKENNQDQATKAQE